MLEALEYNNLNIESVICFETAKDKKNSNDYVTLVIGVHLLAEKVTYLCEQVFYLLKRKHQLIAKNVYFVTEKDLQPYKSNGQYTRFSLRDDIALERFSNIVDEWSSAYLLELIDESVDNETEYETCERCFKSVILKPLAANGFDVLTEWHVHTPIETQILLQVFINKTSCKRSKYESEFVLHKLEKLYKCFDVLLNIFNKHYIGIHQRENAKELESEISVQCNIGVWCDTCIKKCRGQTETAG